MAAHLGLAHGPFELRLGDEGCHRVHDHDVHRAGAHQHVGDLQGLFAVVRLGDEQIVGTHPQTPRIIHIQGMLGVDERGNAALTLGLGNDMQGQRGLSRGLGTVNFRYPALGDAAHSQGQIQGNGTRRNNRDGLVTLF